MAKRQRLTLHQVLDEIFLEPLSDDNIEVHLEEDFNDSDEYLPELNEEVPNKVTESRSRLVPSSNTSYSFH